MTAQTYTHKIIIDKNRVRDDDTLREMILDIKKYSIKHNTVYLSRPHSGVLSGYKLEYNMDEVDRLHLAIKYELFNHAEIRDEPR